MGRHHGKLWRISCRLLYGGLDTEIKAVVGSGASGDVSVTTPGGTAALNGFSFTSDNADLSDLQVVPGSINPGPFSPKTVAYSVYRQADLQFINVTATLADLSASLTINGQPALSSVPATVYLDQGANLIPVVVKASDGINQKAYIISVNGTVSNADLGSLAINRLYGAGKGL